jgi:FKBP-type peptidyl-prolyl cis-trans isomerases 1
VAHYVVGKVVRREAIKNSAVVVLAGSALSTESPPVHATPNIDSKIITLHSGVSIQDFRVGEGALVEEGKRVNIQWSLKRSNGYTIDSSANNDGVPFIFVVGRENGGQKAIEGLDEGIRGMRVGGIRRIVIPPSLAFVEGLEDYKPGPIPEGFGPKQRIRRVMENLMGVPDESFILDVKVTRVQ